MDPQTDLPDLIEDLEVNIDELTTALTPLLSTPLPQTATTLPLLDKAKLYVLSAYAIESLLFSTLQASGTDAKSHAIFPELARLKSYFAKIKDVESAGEQPKARLDKEAAARFIRHGLAGNEKLDLERREKIAKEKARAAIKARLLNKKFDDAAEDEKLKEAAKKRKAEEEAAVAAAEHQEENESEEDHVDSENEDFYGNEAAANNTSPNLPPKPTFSSPTTPIRPSKKSKRRKHNLNSTPLTVPPSSSPATTTPDPRSARRASKRARRQAKRLHKSAHAEAGLPYND